MITELTDFVFSSIAGGVVGNAAYDGLKTILGSHFEKLSDYIQNKEIEKFKGALELLLEDETLKNQIEALKSGKVIDKSLNEIENSDVDIKLGKNGSICDSGNKIKDSTIKIR